MGRPGGVGGVYIDGPYTELPKRWSLWNDLIGRHSTNRAHSLTPKKKKKNLSSFSLFKMIIKYWMAPFYSWAVRTSSKCHTREWPKSPGTIFAATSFNSCKYAEFYRIIIILADFSTKIKCSNFARFQTKSTNNV